MPSRNVVVGVVLAIVAAVALYFLVVKPGKRGGHEFVGYSAHPFKALKNETIEVNWDFPGSIPGRSARLGLVNEATGEGTAHLPRDGKPWAKTYPADANADWTLDIFAVFNNNADIPKLRLSTNANVTTYEFANDETYSPVLLKVVVTRR
ncbi:MAG: hypothetical protein JWL61_3322 [Gemmatimonadetes bacterium]|jgi:hypothetical protein|nr:hypothetical protein [Gemmatimonadota bacterium]